MNPISLWFIAYFLPALVVTILCFTHPSNRMMTVKIGHLLLFASIIISLYFLHLQGLKFPWPKNFLPVGIYIFALGISWWALGEIGILYGMSALIQELAMLSMTFILFQDFSFPLVLLMMVPPFAFGHELDHPHRYLKLIILLIGGGLSVYLFSLSVNVFFIVALHIAVGILLMKTSLIYRFRNS